MTIEIARPPSGFHAPADQRPATMKLTPSIPGNPRLGYQLAALNAAISGFAVFLNSLGVRMFADSTLYTALKNGVVAVAVMLPFLVSRTRRQELARLTRGQWSLLVLIALVAGSVAYGVDFRGRQISTATTAAVIGHAQFLIVAALAAIFLGERFSRTVPVALLVLAIGLTLGVRVNDVRLDGGVPLLVASTVLFAVGAVLIKLALRTVSIATVVAVKMALGAALLFAYVAATGGLAAVAHLSFVQWGFVLVTGLILLAFTLTAIAGLRHASATGVTAVAAAAPIVTAALVAASRRVPMQPSQLLGMGVALAALLTVYVAGRGEELTRGR